MCCTELEDSFLVEVNVVGGPWVTEFCSFFSLSRLFSSSLSPKGCLLVFSSTTPPFPEVFTLNGTLSHFGGGWVRKPGFGLYWSLTDG